MGQGSLKSGRFVNPDVWLLDEIVGSILREEFTACQFITSSRRRPDPSPQVPGNLIPLPLRVVFSALKPLFHFIKDSIDGTATRRRLVDSQLLSQSIQECGVHASWMKLRRKKGALISCEVADTGHVTEPGFAALETSKLLRPFCTSRKWHRLCLRRCLSRTFQPESAQ